jgi:hypothetical protein
MDKEPDGVFKVTWSNGALNYQFPKMVVGLERAKKLIKDHYKTLGETERRATVWVARRNDGTVAAVASNCGDGELTIVSP